MAEISKITLPNGSTYDFKDSIARVTIPFGKVDDTSTSTVFTATVPGITELVDGVCVFLMNGVVTSASGYTLNINGLGAKPVYSTMSAATRTTTIFNVNYTLFFVYNSMRIADGCWDAYYGYYSDSNSVGYQIRTNVLSLPVSGATYRYRLLFMSPDHTHFVPANTSTSTNATAIRAVNQEKIDPFGEIRYYGATSAVAAGSAPSETTLWQQYNITLGYSFNNTGVALALTENQPVYIKCTPQTDGSVIIDSTTPYVQVLPSVQDEKVYIFLGIATNTTTVEMFYFHPIYEYKNGQVRQWTNAAVDAVTINGHTVNSDVPDNAIFTDTTYESKAAIQNGTDVSLVTTGEKYIWNSKTSNTGTVTQVTAGTGLSIGSTAGGNFTTSGTINHTNAVTAQNTQAIYPIKIDAQGHISAYGSAVTPLTASSTLDATKLEGTVPTACLPSYVDDVLQYTAKANFPTTGEAGKIYVDKTTNLTWRWGGSSYVEISPSLALGTTSATAFRGDYGNAAYAHAVTNKGSAFSSGLYKITTNSEGHVTAATAVVKADITGLGIPGTDNDTKNTAGSTDSSKKLFLIGAETQAANPQTYSQDTAYVGTDGKLYSNSKVVLTGGSNASSAVTITPSTTDVYSMTSAGSVTEGTANVPTKIDTSKFSGGSFTGGAFSQGTLPTLTFAMDTTDTKKLKITFGQGTLPTHAADSFTAAALQSGFYTAGTANTPTAVTLPGRSSSAIKAWTGYTAATAAAQTFTGSSN